MGAAETEEDFFAEPLTGLDVIFHGGTAEETGSSSGLHLLGGSTAGGTEVDCWVATSAEEGGQEGQDDDIYIFVLAHLCKRGLASCGGLAVVNGDIIGCLGVELR